MDERIELLERFDHHAPFRNLLSQVASDQETWSGIPMPLEGETLIVEPTYPRAKEFSAQFGPRSGPFTEDADYRIRNTFWSWHRRCEVIVYETKATGKVNYTLINGNHHAAQLLRTLGCSEAWGIAQEKNALDLLGTLVRHHTFKHYLLTGMFLETSERSGVTYLFRKLRPTIAMHAVRGEMRIMCALCLHPIAYYSESWAGAMCPTDDVIAHLMLMRGDESRFWKVATQHPAWVPQAGI